MEDGGGGSLPPTLPSPACPLLSAGAGGVRWCCASPCKPDPWVLAPGLGAAELGPQSPLVQLRRPGLTCYCRSQGCLLKRGVIRSPWKGQMYSVKTPNKDQGASASVGQVTRNLVLSKRRVAGCDRNRRTESYSPDFAPRPSSYCGKRSRC